MFNKFLRIMKDKKQALTERENILKRAKLMDDIINFNSNGEVK